MAEATHVGIDAGGTLTRLRAEKEDQSLELAASGVNLRRASVDSCAQTLSKAIDEAMDKLPSARVNVVAGVAGGYDPRLRERLASTLQAALATRSFDYNLVVQGDIELAHAGGFDDGVGITVIAGTGSVVYGRNAQGNSKLVGGWGYVLGDEGSGTAISVDALRSVCAGIDNDETSTLKDVFAAEFDLHDRNAILEFAYGGAPGIQALAPVVLRTAEQGDVAALAIVREQTRRLASQAATTERLLGTGTTIIAASGGLSQNPFYLDELSAAVERFMPGVSLAPPARDALTEAVRQARLLGSP